MPPSALESLSRLNISYPMLFKIENREKNRTSHTGKPFIILYLIDYKLSLWKPFGKISGDSALN